MTYDLLIGDRAYSSWSLRGWLLFAKFGLDVNLSTTRIYGPDFRADLAAFAPARSVPVIRLPEGPVVMDTLAIAETLAERHPDLPFWPRDPAARALARGITAEMHSSFTTLRSTCPMNMRNVWTGITPDEALKADLDRIEMLWSAARAHAPEGPWLFGDYSIADAFYAPVAVRMVGFSLPVSDKARTYCETVISDPTFLQWRRLAMKEEPLTVYDQPYDKAPWPGPE
ncbi:glutathione S-transferase [Litoreibacter ponti]|uniref:Glutathione S-transferase n=1 Tax=Litoreibacter ponti TaxID=1510457 RepID=A0A2T6BEF6_9RHOB|nr:glutathione S-transferase [Litoreibacter ponti]PTX54443.1 glutathione S-transferase [Litoreibacter ponti]